VFCQPSFSGSWSHILWRGDARAGLNFESAGALVLDFDGGFTLEQAKVRFMGVACYILLTKSHTEENHRFRVVLPLSEVITDRNQYLYNIARLLESNPEADQSCRDAARFWYRSPKLFWQNDIDNKLITLELGLESSVFEANKRALSASFGADYVKGLQMAFDEIADKPAFIRHSESRLVGFLCNNITRIRSNNGHFAARLIAKSLDVSIMTASKIMKWLVAEKVLTVVSRKVVWGLRGFLYGAGDLVRRLFENPTVEVIDRPWRDGESNRMLMRTVRFGLANEWSEGAIKYLITKNQGHRPVNKRRSLGQINSALLNWKSKTLERYANAS